MIFNVWPLPLQRFIVLLFVRNEHSHQSENSMHIPWNELMLISLVYRISGTAAAHSTRSWGGIFVSISNNLENLYDPPNRPDPKRWTDRRTKWNRPFKSAITRWSCGSSYSNFPSGFYDYGNLSFSFNFFAFSILSVKEVDVNGSFVIMRASHAR